MNKDKPMTKAERAKKETRYKILAFIRKLTKEEQEDRAVNLLMLNGNRQTFTNADGTQYETRGESNDGKIED